MFTKVREVVKVARLGMMMMVAVIVRIGSIWMKNTASTMLRFTAIMRNGTMSEGLDRGWSAGPFGWVNRAGEGESATDAADTFIRENPTHPRVDYAYYVKGLVDFERSPNAIERLFRADLTQRPPSTARKAFAAFKTVVEQYPKSEYAHDSLQRMVYLRDRLASEGERNAESGSHAGSYAARAEVGAVDKGH